MKVLIVSRSYPPTLGGLEQQNFSLVQGISKLTEVGEIVNPYGKPLLPLFLPWCLLVLIMRINRYDVVLLGDGLLAIIAWIVKFIFPKKPIVCVAHGLDFTYKNRVYQQLWMKRFILSIDHFIAVSQSTARQIVNRGIENSKITVIPNGSSLPKFSLVDRLTDVARLTGKDFNGKKILVTVGRLVKRKGVDWFVRNVMPRLDENIVYIVIGLGPEFSAIEQSIIEKSLQRKVLLYGHATEEIKWNLLSSADLYIQPNIQVDGDVEGFGISVLEANLAGLTVVASGLEGICDAVSHGNNGFLVESKNSAAFMEQINALLADPLELKSLGYNAKNYCKKNYCWAEIARRYLVVLRQLTANQ